MTCNWVWLLTLCSLLVIAQSLPTNLADDAKKTEQTMRPKPKRAQEMLMFGNQQNRQPEKKPSASYTSTAEKRTLAASGLGGLKAALAEEEKPSHSNIPNNAVYDRDSFSPYDRSYDYGKVMMNDLGYEMPQVWDVPSYSRYYMNEDRRKRSEKSTGSTTVKPSTTSFQSPTSTQQSVQAQVKRRAGTRSLITRFLAGNSLAPSLQNEGVVEIASSPTTRVMSVTFTDEKRFNYHHDLRKEQQLSSRRFIGGNCAMIWGDIGYDGSINQHGNNATETKGSRFTNALCAVRLFGIPLSGNICTQYLRKDLQVSVDTYLQDLTALTFTSRARLHAYKPRSWCDRLWENPSAYKSHNGDHSCMVLTSKVVSDIRHLSVIAHDTQCLSLKNESGITRVKPNRLMSNCQLNINSFSEITENTVMVIKVTLIKVTLKWSNKCIEFSFSRRKFEGTVVFIMLCVCIYNVMNLLAAHTLCLTSIIVIAFNDTTLLTLELPKWSKPLLLYSFSVFFFIFNVSDGNIIRKSIVPVLQAALQLTGQWTAMFVDHRNMIKYEV
ncbi:hypothetical protein E2986_09061 [Frieseomelitta varia]|uniref:Uncharacterized protein n=2 Tax=Frieseomelitta varia TaxID=561572 RepID=A0A833VKY8_9HYME|nr:hypothetical protein E2986_09061 [Frieseomelitta varia]